ncbi:MAG: hypothetical protein U9Q33_07825 [Campylobacterota bacterium]|nr:hypothetical protein [Campylobacterota bacterium]
MKVSFLKSLQNTELYKEFNNLKIELVKESFDKENRHNSYAKHINIIFYKLVFKGFK